MTHAGDKHPNIHAPWSQWSNDQTLHVAVAYSNPYRWETRRRLMNDFRHHMSGHANVELHIGELAYGDRPFEVTGSHPNDRQFRTNSELFHKENVLNEIIKSFPLDWKYGCYIDADFTFTRHDWAVETIHQLQHHEWVQPFSTYTNLSAKSYGGCRPGNISESFACKYIRNGYCLPACVDFGGWGACGEGGYGFDHKGNPSTKWVPVGATGGAWAFRRSAFEAVGGLLDSTILGSGDWFMTFGLVSQAPQYAIHKSKYHPHYIAAINSWQEKARELKANIGVVDQFAVHHFHGAMKNRGYGHRDKILVRHQFDPIHDLKKNWQGIYELTGNKPQLRDHIRQYFLSRDEDNPAG